MAELFSLKYRAFISYSHADTAWAKWLHRALEGFRIDKDLVGRQTPAGFIPKTMKPIFRDIDEALKRYLESVAIRERLTEIDPTNANWQLALSVSFGRPAREVVGQYHPG